jgi:hypothetical protein
MVASSPTIPAPATSATSVAMPTITKRLSPADVTKHHNDGKCFHCDDLFTQGHKQVYKQLFNIEVVDEDDSPQTEEADDATISIHALTGIQYRSRKTMQVFIDINDIRLTTLLDSGSMHNFIDTKPRHKQGSHWDAGPVCASLWQTMTNFKVQDAAGVYRCPSGASSSPSIVTGSPLVLTTWYLAYNGWNRSTLYCGTSAGAHSNSSGTGTSTLVGRHCLCCKWRATSWTIYSSISSNCSLSLPGCHPTAVAATASVSCQARCLPRSDCTIPPRQRGAMTAPPRRRGPGPRPPTSFKYRLRRSVPSNSYSSPVRDRKTCRFLFCFILFAISQTTNKHKNVIVMFNGEE